MPTEVIMPQMGESIVEGTIAKWLKKPGESIQKDEPLFEISTDKVDAEIPSPAAGVVAEIRFAVGETVPINTVVAVLAEPGTVIAPAVKAAPAAAAGPVAEPTPVVMPQMGESIVEGTIAKWLKKPGERVEKDEPLFEISTDKVDAEIPSPEAGTLLEIRVQVGETVEINTVVALIGEPGALLATAGGEAVAEGEFAPAASYDPSLPYEVATTDASGRKLRSSPLVRRIARENRLDLAAIRGTGLGGRITKQDVLEHLKKYGPGSAKAAESAEPAGLFEATRPLSRMRSIIASRMVESKRVAPHVHSVYKIDMTRVARIRAAEKARFERQYGVRLTYMPFIAKAAVEALEMYPILNASLLDDQVHYHGNIHLGIAVALEWGLIVPVIRQAETKSFVELARSVADLAARARSKKLSPDEAQGSTFTLTNSGVFGGEFGTPILNQPEAGILAIGGLRKEPVVLTDAEGNDTLGIRQMQSYCLGFDHRLIDGADAGKFLATFQKKLENWDEGLE